jgi:hypothetical protein
VLPHQGEFVIDFGSLVVCLYVPRSMFNYVHRHTPRVVTTEAGRVKQDKQALLGHSISGEDPKVRITCSRKDFFYFRFQDNSVSFPNISGFDYVQALDFGGARHIRLVSACSVFMCQMCATVFGQCGSAILPNQIWSIIKLTALLSVKYGAAGGGVCSGSVDVVACQQQ